MTDAKTEDVPVTEKSTEDVLPSMFSDIGEEISIKADLVYFKENGNIHVVVKSGNVDETKLESLGLKPVEFNFSRPDYDAILTYRSRCSVANGTTGRMIVDPNKLRYFLILKHLRSWNLEGEDGKVIELKFDDDSETLSSETMKVVYGVNPKILDGIFELLEKEITV